MTILGGGNSNYFLEFSLPTWGNESNLTNIFQMGWFNHQPVDMENPPLFTTGFTRISGGCLGFQRSQP